MDDIGKFRGVRARFFTPPMPAGTGVEVSRLLPGVLVEIDAVAVVDYGRYLLYAEAIFSVCRQIPIPGKEPGVTLLSL